MSDHQTTPAFECNWVTLGQGRLTLWHRPGARAVAELRAFGCDCVVTLLSSREGASTVGKHVEQAGIEWFWLPLENGQPPQGAASEAVLSAIPVLWQRLDAGRSILIHCSAGIHRTGMIAYALLRWRGHDEDEALVVIEKMRLHTRTGIQRKHLDWANEMVVTVNQGK